MFEVTYLETPVGFLVLTADHKSVIRIDFADKLPEKAVNRPTSMLLKKALSQLSEYFAGVRMVFDFPIRPEGTDFQIRVWNELLKIPFGQTASYLEMAKRLGDEKCIRAAASANGKNPIAVVIPCHRVIGTDGKLVGYGGGLWRKKILLQHEMAFVKQEGLLF